MGFPDGFDFYWQNKFESTRPGCGKDNAEKEANVGHEKYVEVYIVTVAKFGLQLCSLILLWLSVSTWLRSYRLREGNPFHTRCRLSSAF